jgi:phenylacetate-CoA ligase
MDTLMVKVEVTEETFSDKMKDMMALQKKVQDELTAVLNVGAKVELVEPGSIPRSPGKAVRVVDLRKDKI